MILGYIDREDRAYDLNFATLRLKIRVEPHGGGGTGTVVFAPSRGAEPTAFRILGEAGATANVSMNHGGHRIPLLRPVEGRLYRHERGLFFIAEPAKRSPEDPTYYLVKLQALPSAVQFFFEDQQGTELISIPSDEVIGVGREADTMNVTVSAATLALPKEKLAYAIGFAPAARLASLLAGLGSRE